MKIQFYNPKTTAEITIKKEFYDFLNDSYNEAINEKSINMEFYSLVLNVNEFKGMDDKTENDPFTDQQKKYVEQLQEIVHSAKMANLDEIMLEKADL